MEGNVKFEVSSVSQNDSGFTGSYLNGQRSTYSSPSIDRSASSREGWDGRGFSSGAAMSKLKDSLVADFPPLSQCLILEPIKMGDSKYTRAGALSRALGVSTFGNVSKDNSFAGAQSRLLHTFNTDEVKRSRATVAERSMKARNRVKRLDESLNKLNSYCEATNSKKQQTNDRSSGLYLLKMGNQSLQSSLELAAQKLEDINTNIVLNKRGRTPMGDLRAEGRSYEVPRQHLVLGNDKDSAKEGSSEIAERKVQPLPAGGEGWDKRKKRTRSVSSVSRRHLLRNDKDSAKDNSCSVAEGNVQPLSTGGEGWDKRVKRTRSVTSVFPKPHNSYRERKRTMHGRPGNDSSIHTSDGPAFRSGSSSGANGSNKMEGSPSTASFIGLMALKNESEKPSPSRELTGMNKERRPRKENTKLNMPEEPYLFSSSSFTKGKASRAHKRCPRSVANSSPNFSRLSGTTEDREQPLNVNKVQSLAAVNNRKRPLPTDSSPPPMSQWVGQRPQKISRNRRTNIVSLTSNHDERQISAEGRTASGSSTRITGGMNGSPVRNIMSSSQQLKEKLESAPSPARLSECEGKCAVENRLMDIVLRAADINDKGTNGHLDANYSGVSTKSKLPVKDATGDGIHRQGRSGRCSSFPKGGISPLREKPESPAGAKPGSATHCSVKNGSKSGRPPKKHFGRKGLSCLGPDTTPPSSSSLLFSGESDDDEEEIFAAAQFASSASYNGCSSSFWKTLEPLFSVRVDDQIFLEEQLKAHGNHLSNLSQMKVMGNRMMNNISQAKIHRARSSLGGESKTFFLDNGLTDSTQTGDFIIQLHDLDSSFRGLDSEKGPNKLTPLYQRVLSAIIIEDELEEYEYNHLLSNSSSSANREDPCKAYCYDHARHSRFSSSQVHLHSQIDEGSYCLPHLLGKANPGHQNEVNGSLAISIDASGSCSLGCECDQMCMDDKLLLELQCIGIYTDTMPDLAEGDDELISEDITQLKNQHFEQAAKEKAYLERIHEAIEMKDVKWLDLERVAMDRLTELTFRKLLATHANYAARIGVNKVSRHASQAFIKRTLARCQEYNDAGKSCFSEPALQDVLLAVPSNNTAAGTSVQAGQVSEARASGPSLVDSKPFDLLRDKSERSPFEAFESITQSDHAFAKNVPIVNRGKKDVLLDDVGGTASRSTSVLESRLPGRAKGKRSERDSSGKNSRASISNSKAERKTKSKPKPKAARLSTHPLQYAARFSGKLVTNPNNLTQEHQISPPEKIPGSPNERNDTNHAIDLSSLPLSELDSIDDLNVANELDGNEDLSSWLNFDEVEGLQDDDCIGGLQIPMDDLSDLNMLL